MNILDYLLNNYPSNTHDSNTLPLLINKAQVYKWQGDNDSCKKILEDIDWEPLSDMFKMAKCVLLEEYESTIKLMKKIGKNDRFNELAYRKWPLFKELRNYPGFPKAFEEIFEHPFSVVTTSIYDNVAVGVVEIARTQNLAKANIEKKANSFPGSKSKVKRRKKKR